MIFSVRKNTEKPAEQCRIRHIAPFACQRRDKEFALFVRLRIRQPADRQRGGPDLQRAFIAINGETWNILS